ncbi:hypothetical protein BDR07DRAFT_1498362 [Suillus spraguei]|nr:hypothetical protein BDR07DRAFT_1498362 [Suillus spraguei]
MQGSLQQQQVQLRALEKLTYYISAYSILPSLFYSTSPTPGSTTALSHRHPTMGVAQVWTRENEVITALALEGRYAGCPPFHPFIIGVDVSLSSPTMDDDPSTQTRKKCGHRKRPLDDEASQRILDAFNIQWFMGRGEAELAAMNSVGAINAVMTDDSDVFAFGCRCIIRNSSFSDTTVSVYEAAMPLEDYALVSLLCGGDYDTACLAVVLQLHSGSHAWYGQLLARAESGCEFAGPYRRAWRNDVQRHSAMTHIANRTVPPIVGRQSSQRVSELHTWSAYLHPAIHDTLVSIRKPGVPMPEKLRLWWCLYWAGRIQVAYSTHSVAIVWPGAVTSELLQDLSLATDQPGSRTRRSCNSPFFLHFVHKPQTVGEVCGYNARMPADALIKETFRAVKAVSHVGAQGHLYNAWTKFMWSESLLLLTDTVGESSKTPAKSQEKEHSSECEVVAGPSLLDTITLTNNSERDDEWVIDLTIDYFGCSSGSKSKGKSKAQPTDIIDLNLILAGDHIRMFHNEKLFD